MVLSDLFSQIHYIIVETTLILLAKMSQTQLQVGTAG